MKKDLVPKLRCTECGGNMRLLHNSEADSQEIRTGELACHDCGRRSKISKGIAYLLPGNMHHLLKAEKEGWVIRAKEKNWYDVSDDYLLSLPFPEQSNEEVDWKIAREPFYHMVDSVFTDWKGKTVLDIGAGKPWSSRYLSKKGAHVISTDILEDDRIGLGVADVYMKHDGTFFERALADMNHLPFQDGCMDVVVYQGALHHSLDLWRSLQEADRVLKKGGHILFTSEGCGGILSRESVGKPTDDGINEHNYKNIRYIYYLKKLGYRINTYHEPKFYEKHGTSTIRFWLRECWRFGRGGLLMLVAEKK